MLVVLLALGCHKKPPEIPVIPDVVTEALPAPEVPPPPAPAPAPMPAMRTIYFDFDRSDIRPDASADLAVDLAALQAAPQVMVEIEGHCDERGSTEYNLALGQRRADAAARWLVNGGIARSRIRTTSYGEERPADRGHDEDAWARNRRAELVISGPLVAGP